jgi:PAS domain-containing protein
MKIRNARRWAPGGGWRYLAALAAFVLALVVRRELHPILGHYLPALFFTVAAILVEFFFGLGPALTVLFISLPALDFYFVPPFEDFGEIDRTDFIVIAGHLAINLLGIGLIEWLRRVQFQAELLAEVSRSRYEILLRVDNERMLAEDTTRLTNRLLRNFTANLDSVMYIGNSSIGYEFIGEMLRREADLPLADTRGRDFLYILHPEDAEAIEADLRGDSDSLERRQFRLRVRRKNGSYHHHDCELEFFKTQSGVFVVIRQTVAPVVASPATV